MRYNNPFAPVPQQPLFNTEGGGMAPGGGAPAGGAPAGGGSGGGAPAGGGSQAIAIAPDTRIVVDGKETTYGEHLKGFVPRAEHEGFQKNYRTELRNNLAQLAQSIQRQQQQGGGQRQGQADPFADIWNAPLVDGKMLKQLSDAGFGNLAGQLRQQQAEMAALKKQLGGLSGGFSTLADRNLHSDFARRIDSAITTAVGEDAIKDPFLRDLAEDVWHSHENWTRGKEDQEFTDIFTKRLGAMEKYFRARDKARLDAAKNRRWQRPGGSGNPSGMPKFDPRKTNRDAASALFNPSLNT